jgi:hypothetical protein
MWYRRIAYNSTAVVYILHYKIRLPSVESIQWLHGKKKIQQKIQEISESSNIVSECRILKTIILQVADEILRKYKALTQKFSIQEVSSIKVHWHWDWW